MAATCAACLSPIAAGDRFVLSGTEVFHRTCARGINRSQRTRMELRILELERELAAERAAVQNLRGAADAELNIARKIKREVEGMDRDLRVARAGRDAALRDSAYWQERHAAAERSKALLRSEIDALTEAARVRVAPPPQGGETPAATKDDRDATEIRFSLLELDKP